MTVAEFIEKSWVDDRFDISITNFDGIRINKSVTGMMNFPFAVHPYANRIHVSHLPTGFIICRVNLREEGFRLCEALVELTGGTEPWEQHWDKIDNIPAPILEVIEQVGELINQARAQ